MSAELCLSLEWVSTDGGFPAGEAFHLLQYTNAAAHLSCSILHKMDGWQNMMRL